MTRNEVVKKMISKAIAITGKNSKNWTRDAENEIWEICSDWNGSNWEDAIFMCEHGNEETGYVDGFYIEDDYFIVEE